MVLISSEQDQKLLGSGGFRLEDFGVSEDENDGYNVSMGFQGRFQSAEDVVGFYNRFVKQDVQQKTQAYGSSQEAIEEIAGTDSPAMYGREEDMEGQWAINVDRVLAGDEFDPEDPFDDAIDQISAMTLTAISLAYSDPDTVHTKGFYEELYQDLDEAESQGPIEIPVRERPETPYDDEIIEELDLSDEELEQGGREIVHEKILSGTIEDAKEFIEEIEEPDYDALIDAETEAKDRVTMKSYLEEKKNEEQPEENLS